MSDNINVLLIGCGYMGIEYTKVLKEFDVDLTVVGNSVMGVDDFLKETGVNAIPGGVSKYLSDNPKTADVAIVATPVETLAEHTIELIQHGYRKILVEKPAGIDEGELNNISVVAKENNAEVYIAYNRRFFASTSKAIEIIKDDGGVTSFSFEFTEWADSVQNSGQMQDVLENWLLANSSHVIDLAFFLGGKPALLSSFVEGSLSWHKNGSNYVGAGKTDGGALFSYHANWKAPGRWGVEILTEKHRLIFRPLEKLQCQNLNSVAIENIQIDDEWDIKYKPGLYAELEAFIYKKNEDRLLDIEEAVKCIPIYKRIAGISD